MSKVKNHCVDCGTEIDPRSTRCKSCVLKARWRCGDFDNLFNENTRRKMSKGVKVAWKRGDYDSEETRHKMSETTKASHARGDFDDAYGEESR